MDAHFDTNSYHPSFDFNHAVFSDTFSHFYQVIHEYNLPDDVVQNAVHSACDFMHMNDLTVRPDISTGVYTYDPTTFNDDCLGFSRQQMLDMGPNPLLGSGKLGTLDRFAGCSQTAEIVIFVR